VVRQVASVQGGQSSSRPTHNINPTPRSAARSSAHSNLASTTRPGTTAWPHDNRAARRPGYVQQFGRGRQPARVQAARLRRNRAVRGNRLCAAAWSRTTVGRVETSPARGSLVACGNPAVTTAWPRANLACANSLLHRQPGCTSQPDRAQTQSRANRSHTATAPRGSAHTGGASCPPV
jgi:hypothetical protein